jgi:hypothetical protein
MTCHARNAAALGQRLRSLGTNGLAASSRRNTSTALNRPPSSFQSTPGEEISAARWQVARAAPYGKETHKGPEASGPRWFLVGVVHQPSRDRTFNMTADPIYAAGLPTAPTPGKGIPHR